MPVYGLCEWNHNWIKSLARLNELKNRQMQHEQGQHNAENSAYFMKGAIENQKYHMDTWTSPFGLPAGQVLHKVADVPITPTVDGEE